MHGNQLVVAIARHERRALDAIAGIVIWENGSKPGTIVNSKTTHRTMGGGDISHTEAYKLRCIDQGAYQNLFIARSAENEAIVF